MFENKYPYTDFSQLNLDWFLLKFKELLEEQERVSGKVQELDETVQQFTKFVTSYFDDLDVQQEINNKLDAMAADGTLSDLLAPLVGDDIQTSVTGWLNEHVDPVGSAVVVDDTLTIEGAAADAKVTGDTLNIKMPKSTTIEHVTTNKDLNTLDVNNSCTWGSADTTLHAPNNESAGFVFCFGVGSVQKYQIAFGFISGKMYYRTNTASGWTTWKTILNINDVPANIVSSTDILNALGNATNKVLSQKFITDFYNSFIKTDFQKCRTNEIVGGIKQAGYSGSIAGGNNQFMTLQELENYDAFYFYTYIPTEIYFDSSTIQDMSYLSVCVGNNPSGIWNDSTAGSLRMSIENGVRYRKSENNLPTVNNVLSVASNSIITITVPHETNCDFFIKNKIILNRNIVPISNKKCFVKYETGAFKYASERLLIYIPTNIGYIRYNINHYNSPSINANSWGIWNAYWVDDNLSNELALTASGEWECAVHLDGRPDFSGGIAHGDEIYSNIYVFIDGQLTPINSLSTNTYFEELRIVEDSTLYDPNDSVTEIASHGREYIFKADELKLNQNLTWKVAEALTSCYMAMFTPSKTVTNTVYTNLNFVPETIPNPIVTDKIENDVTKAAIYSSTSGFFAEFEISKYPKGLTGGDKWLLTDNGGGSYNKMYYIVCNGGSSTIGERWDTTTVYKLKKS